MNNGSKHPVDTMMMHIMWFLSIHVLLSWKQWILESINARKLFLSNFWAKFMMVSYNWFQCNIAFLRESNKVVRPILAHCVSIFSAAMKLNLELLLRTIYFVTYNHHFTCCGAVLSINVVDISTGPSLILLSGLSESCNSLRVVFNSSWSEQVNLNWHGISMPPCCRSYEYCLLPVASHIIASVKRKTEQIDEIPFRA